MDTSHPAGYRFNLSSKGPLLAILVLSLPGTNKLNSTIGSICFYR